MQPVKILVTGGNGFVGRQICHLANQQGIQVISLSRTGQPATYAASPVPSEGSSLQFWGSNPVSQQLMLPVLCLLLSGSMLV